MRQYQIFEEIIFKKLSLPFERPWNFLRFFNDIWKVEYMTPL